MRVEIVYALATTQETVVLELGTGASAREAVHASGLLQRHREIDAEAMLLGMFGKRIRPEQILREGDRVEILRPLAQDPKEARRRRVRRALRG